MNVKSTITCSRYLNSASGFMQWRNRHPGTHTKCIFLSMQKKKEKKRVQCILRIRGKQIYSCTHILERSYAIRRSCTNLYSNTKLTFAVCGHNHSPFTSNHLSESLLNLRQAFSRRTIIVIYNVALVGALQFVRNLLIRSGVGLRKS